jgi:hypothetical protein
LTRANVKRMSGPDQVRAELRGIWQLDDAEFAAILHGDAPLAQAFIIHSDLDALFQDYAVERTWMRDPKSWLDGRTPIEHMASDRADGLIRAWLERISGLR